MAESHISDDMRAAIGRVIWRRVSHPVSASDIRRWAVAVHYPEPPPRRFLDADVAAGTRWGGIVAPEEFNPFAWVVADEEGPSVAIDPGDPDKTELQLGIRGPGLRFQLNGGSEAEYGTPIRPGDVITSVLRLDSYSEREGRMGTMLFTVTEDVWTNQDDELVKRFRRTGIRYGSR